VTETGGTSGVVETGGVVATGGAETGALSQPAEKAQPAECRAAPAPASQSRPGAMRPRAELRNPQQRWHDDLDASQPDSGGCFLPDRRAPGRRLNRVRAARASCVRVSSSKRR